jgi:hypothetical protein
MRTFCTGVQALTRSRAVAAMIERREVLTTTS